MLARGYNKGEEQCSVKCLPKQNLSLPDTGGSTNSTEYLAEISPRSQVYCANSSKRNQVCILYTEERRKRCTILISSPGVLHCKAEERKFEQLRQERGKEIRYLQYCLSLNRYVHVQFMCSSKRCISRLCVKVSSSPY